MQDNCLMSNPKHGVGLLKTVFAMHLMQDAILKMFVSYLSLGAINRGGLMLAGK